MAPPIEDELEELRAIRAVEERLRAGAEALRQLEEDERRYQELTTTIWELPIPKDAEIGPARWAWDAALAACEELGLDANAIELRWYSLQPERGFTPLSVAKTEGEYGFVLPEREPNVAWIRVNTGTQRAHTVVHELAHLAGILDETEAEEIAKRVVRARNL